MKSKENEKKTFDVTITFKRETDCYVVKGVDLVLPTLEGTDETKEKIILKALRIDGRSRWSNEFIQTIDPSITVGIPGFESISDEPQIWFRTHQLKVHAKPVHFLQRDLEI